MDWCRGNYFSCWGSFLWFNDVILNVGFYVILIDCDRYCCEVIFNLRLRVMNV